MKDVFDQKFCMLLSLIRKEASKKLVNNNGKA